MLCKSQKINSSKVSKTAYASYLSSARECIKRWRAGL